MQVPDFFGLREAMRGADERLEGIISHVQLEQRFRRIIRCVRSTTWSTC